MLPCKEGCPHEVRLEELERQLELYIKEINRCSVEKDVKIENTAQLFTKLDSKLDQLENNITAIKEIVEAWNSAKGFVVGIRTVGSALQFVGKTVLVVGAIWVAVKTGHWIGNDK